MTVRYDFQELIDVIAPDPTEVYARIKVSTILGVTHKEIANWLFRGITSGDADRLACKVRLHPSLIWPTWFDDADLENPCRWCGEIILNGRRSFCSDGHWLQYRTECRRDQYRTAKWWARLDRYREMFTLNPSVLDLEVQSA